MTNNELFKIGKLYKLSKHAIDRIEKYREQWPNFRPRLNLRNENGFFIEQKEFTQLIEENTSIFILDCKKSDYDNKPLSHKGLVLIKILISNGKIGWTKADITDWEEIKLTK